MYTMKNEYVKNEFHGILTGREGVFIFKTIDNFRMLTDTYEGGHMS